MFLIYVNSLNGRIPDLCINFRKTDTMIHTLTSLRFLFALMVFGAHCYILDPVFDAHCFKEGFVGVSFFFVLSGFIIAYNYRDKLQARTISRRSFWVARVARIYPLHWLTLLVAALAGGYVVADGIVDWCKHFFSSALLLQAYIPEPSYFFSFNSPSWSLCCEQLFYLCFPFLIRWAKDGTRLCCLFLFCALLVPIGMYCTPEAAIKSYWYVNPLARFPDFIVGMLLYEVYRRLDTNKITYRQGTILEILAVVVFSGFYFYAAAIPKVYRYSCYYWLPIAFLLLCFALQRGTISRLLSNKYFVIGGEISYSFYLIHLFVLLTYIEIQKKQGWAISWTVSVPVLFCIIFVLSLLSYYRFEKPMNKFVKKRLNN